MKHSKLILGGLLITLMVGAATASTAELTIFPQESSTEINSFTSYEVTIENIGEVKDVYSLSSTAREIDIAPRKVEIPPQGEETVNIWYNPDTGKDEGRHGFTITAASRATGDRYSVDGVAKVIKDHNIELTASENSKTSCLGHSTEYSLEVENKGIQPETFKLRASNGKVPENQITLEEGETRDITLEISSETPVEKEIDLTASSTTSYATDTENIQFNAERCYASKLTPEEKEPAIPAKTESDISFTLENTGTKSDNFTLESNIGELETEQLEVDSGEEETFNVAITPQDIRTQRLEVTASSNSRSSATATVSSYNGMNSRVSVGEEETICEREQGDLEVSVENTGEAPEQFQLSSNTGELEEKAFQLDINESEDTEISFNGSNFEEGIEKEVELSSTPSTFGEPVSTAESSLNVQNCWDLNMTVVPRVASAGENRSTIYEIQLENPGTNENTYEISYEGPSWVEVEPEEVTVASGEMEKAFIYAGIPFQKKGEIKIRATAEGTQVSETEEVKLLVGKDITQEELEESLRDEEDEVNTKLTDGLTGSFVDSLDETGKVIGSIVIGALVTIGVLYS